MTDPIASALIAVTGMLSVAILGAIVQVAVTREVIRNEFTRVAEQLAREAGYRRGEAKATRVADAVAHLLALSDPESNANIVYRDVVALIHRIQLYCDPGIQPDRDLRGALNELGFALKAYLKLPDRFDETGEDVYRSILEIHSRVADHARAIVALGHRHPSLPARAT